MKIELSEKLLQLIDPNSLAEASEKFTLRMFSSLKEYGFQLSPDFLFLLKKYFLVSLFIPLDGGRRFKFDPLECLVLDPDQTHLYKKLIQKEICPIGWGNGWHFFISDDLDCVMIHDAYSGFIQMKSLNEAIEFFFNLKEVKYKFIDIDEELNPIH